MPNILKHFFRPQVGSYTFPPADEIQVEEEKTDQPEEERLPDEGDHAEAVSYTHLTLPTNSRV